MIQFFLGFFDKYKIQKNSIYLFICCRFNASLLNKIISLLLKKVLLTSSLIGIMYPHFVKS